MSQSIASRNVLNIQKKEAIGRENSVPLRHLARLRESGMMQDEKTVRYIGELSGIEETQNPQLQRHLPFSTPLIWLKRGWSDMVTQPLPSLAYGVAVFALSAISVWILVRYGRDYLLFPVLSGLLIVAPFFATGLYLKSRNLAEKKPVILMLHVPLYTEAVLHKAAAVWKGGVVLGGGIHGGIYPDTVSTEFITLTTAKDSPVELVLAGHVHFALKSDIQGEKNIPQIIGDAGYKGKATIIQISG